MNKITLEEAEYWSHFQLICVKLRAKGIRVSITKIRKGMALMEPEIKRLKREIELEKLSHEDIGVPDLDSPKQLASALEFHGYKLSKTDKGNYSTNKQWLEDNKDDPLVAKIIEYREVKKIYNDFFAKILDMQQYSCPEALVDGAEYGMVYPEMNVFGAQTGRFSSSCPNIQQIPKRSKKWGALARSIFIPKEGTKWYSLDWSNQEGRLAVHYAKKLGSPGIDEMVKAFNENPKLDMHQKVAEIVGIERSAAKAINLGLMYSMGQGKLCKSLGLPVITVKTKYGEQEQAGPEGKKLIDRYHQYLPFIKDLDNKCKEQIKKQGFIYTLNRRKLLNEPGKEYKALNKLIQGSAADQCLQVLNLADSLGIDIICLVHDEFNIQGNELDMINLRHIMAHSYKFEIPFRAEVSVGDSWGTLEEI